MDEYELIQFAVYLDKLKWKKESIQTVEDFLSSVALFLKLRLKENGHSYISYIGLENQNMISKLKDFLEIYNINIKIQPYELNNKFIEFNKVKLISICLNALLNQKYFLVFSFYLKK